MKIHLMMHFIKCVNKFNMKKLHMKLYLNTFGHHI